MLLLAEGQTFEAWGPSKSNALGEVEEHWIQKYFFFLIFCARTKYRVRINYRRILQNHIFTNTEHKYMMLLPFESPTTSKGTTRIVRAHQQRSRERNTRHA